MDLHTLHRQIAPPVDYERAADHYPREARRTRRVSADVLCAFLLTAVAAALAVSL